MKRSASKSITRCPHINRLQLPIRDIIFSTLERPQTSLSPATFANSIAAGVLLLSPIQATSSFSIWCLPCPPLSGPVSPTLACLSCLFASRALHGVAPHAVLCSGPDPACPRHRGSSSSPPCSCGSTKMRRSSSVAFGCRRCTCSWKNMDNDQKLSFSPLLCTPLPFWASFPLVPVLSPGMGGTPQPILLEDGNGVRAEARL